MSSEPYSVSGLGSHSSVFEKVPADVCQRLDQAIVDREARSMGPAAVSARRGGGVRCGRCAHAAAGRMVLAERTSRSRATPGNNLFTCMSAAAIACNEWISRGARRVAALPRTSRVNTPRPAS